MAKPALKPIWATASFNLPISGLPNKVQPPAGWQAAGWDENEEPPPNYVNWTLNNTYQWIDFLDEANSRAASFVVGASTGRVLLGATDADCDGTSDQVEINAAIALVAAAGGGVVLLTEGTFVLDGKIVHDATVQLKGMGRATVLQIAATVTTDFNIIEVSSKDSCAVLDLAIDGNTGSGHGHFHTAISVLGTSLAALIERVWVDDLAVSGGSTYGLGIEVTGSAARARVLNSKASNCGAAGISVTTSAAPGRTLIHHNQVWGCQEGIETWGGPGVSLTYNKIYDSTATGIALGYTGVPIAPSDCQVHGNEIYTSGGQGIYATGADCSIHHNTVVDTGSHGIWLDGLDTSSVKDNHLRDVAIRGVFVDGCDYTEVADNHITDVSQALTATDAGIYIDGGTKCTVKTNKFRNTGGIVSKHSIETAAGGSGACAIYDNDCRAGSSGVEISNAAGDEVSCPVYVWNGAAQVTGTAAMNFCNIIV